MIKDPLHDYTPFRWAEDKNAMNMEFRILVKEYILAKNEAIIKNDDDVLIALYKKGLLDRIFTLPTDDIVAHLTCLKYSLETSLTSTDRMILYNAVRNIWRHVIDLDIAKYRLYDNEEAKASMINDCTREYFKWFVSHSGYGRKLITFPSTWLTFPVKLRLVDEIEVKILVRYLNFLSRYSDKLELR